MYVKLGVFEVQIVINDLFLHLLLKWVLSEVLIRLMVEMGRIGGHTLVDVGLKQLHSFRLLLDVSRLVNVDHFLLDPFHQVLSFEIHYFVA